MRKVWESLLGCQEVLMVLQQSEVLSLEGFDSGPALQRLHLTVGRARREMAVASTNLPNSL